MKEKIKYRLGFRGKRQTYLFCLWKEYWVDNKVVFAKIIFWFDGGFQ